MGKTVAATTPLLCCVSQHLTIRCVNLTGVWPMTGTLLSIQRVNPLHQARCPCVAVLALLEMSKSYKCNVVEFPLHTNKNIHISLYTLVDIYQGIGSFPVWRFGLYSPNHLCYRKYILILIKALICGYFEPKKLRARLPKKAATPL